MCSHRTATLQVLDLLKPDGTKQGGGKTLQMRFDGSSGVRVEGLTEEVVVNGAPPLPRGTPRPCCPPAAAPPGGCVALTHACIAAAAPVSE